MKLSGFPLEILKLCCSTFVVSRAEHLFAGQKLWGFFFGKSVWFMLQTCHVFKGIGPSPARVSILILITSTKEAIWVVLFVCLLAGFRKRQRKIVTEALPGMCLSPGTYAFIFHSDLNPGFILSCAKWYFGSCLLGPLQNNSGKFTLKNKSYQGYLAWLRSASWSWLQVSDAILVTKYLITSSEIVCTLLLPHLFD